MIDSEKNNIILIGMPGCGKSTVGGILADRLGRDFLDLDDEIEKTFGKSSENIINDEGEAAFREKESSVLKALCALPHKVIACGGGTVISAENRSVMKDGSLVIWIQRPEELLPTAGRPISQKTDLHELYIRREPLYIESADFAFANDSSPEDCAERIINALTDN